MKNASKISLFALLLDIPSVTTLKAGLALRLLNPYEFAIARALPRSSAVQMGRRIICIRLFHPCCPYLSSNQNLCKPWFSLLSKKTKTRKSDEDSFKVLPYQNHDVPDKLAAVIDSCLLSG